MFSRPRPESSILRGAGTWRELARRLLIALAAISALLPATPAAAEFLPRADEVALPEERALFDETLTMLLDSTRPDDARTLSALDAALARLGRPTRLRGLLQFFRAVSLYDANQFLVAREAVDESIRLLPEYSGPLLLASRIYVYADEPGPAADYLIRASRIDPQIVSRLPEYDVNGIFHRLRVQRDRRRTGALSERLIEIGWLAETMEGRSSLALQAIDARIERGDVAGAKALVPKLLNPADSRRLLVSNRYRALWPAIEQWAGPRLENQWRAFLAEARKNWEASRDPDHARAYVRVLDAAGHDETIIKEMLPLFSKPLDPTDDYELIYVTPALAEALAAKGRWADVERMYAAASRAWPLGEHANALNIAGNRARFLFYAGKTKEALAAMDSAIASAETIGSEVNGDAVALMHRYRACMLHALGRSGQAVLSRIHASNLPASSLASLNLCLDRQEAARDLLVEALENEDRRDEVLLFVQTQDEPPMQSAYGRLMHQRQSALRADPKLLSAVARHGRILPFTLSEGAPAE